MSFAPNPGSLVRVRSKYDHESSPALIGIITKVVPDGQGDRIQVFGEPFEHSLSAYVILEIIHEPEIAVEATQSPPKATKQNSRPETSEERDEDVRRQIEAWIDEAWFALENVRKSRVWFEPFSDCLDPIIKAQDALQVLSSYDIVARHGFDMTEVRRPFKP